MTHFIPRIAISRELFLTVEFPICGSLITKNNFGVKNHRTPSAFGVPNFCCLGTNLCRAHLIRAYTRADGLNLVLPWAAYVADDFLIACISGVQGHKKAMVWTAS